MPDITPWQQGVGAKYSALFYTQSGENEEQSQIFQIDFQFHITSSVSSCSLTTAYVSLTGFMTVAVIWTGVCPHGQNTDSFKSQTAFYSS